MNNFLVISGIVAVLVFPCVLSDFPLAQQCPDIGMQFDKLQERVEVIPCGNTRCKLRKGTNITVNFRFKPTYEVTELKNDVQALITGLPLPFVGVTGTSVCDKVTLAASGAAAPCPLAADTEYQVTNYIFVEEFYPNVDMKVHWGLKSQKNKDVICFEVPAIIKKSH